MAYFCSKTGVRVVAPGVCKAVDPTNGVDLYTEGAVEAAPPPPQVVADEPPAFAGGFQVAESPADDEVPTVLAVEPTPAADPPPATGKKPGKK